MLLISWNGCILRGQWDHILALLGLDWHSLWMCSVRQQHAADWGSKEDSSLDCYPVATQEWGVGRMCVNFSHVFAFSSYRKKNKLTF